MRRVAATALIAFLAAGCTSDGSKGSPATAPASTGTSPEAKPADPTKAGETIPTDKEKADARRQAELIAALAGKRLPPEGEEAPPSTAPEIVVDGKTGVRLERIPKSRSVYVKDGAVYHRFIMPGLGVPLVREDEGAYYVEAPPEQRAGDDPEVDPTLADLAPIQEFPESEAEVVTPPVSSRQIRLEERSQGLPKSGFWRTNLDVADLDGDGTPEIVTPPPRMTPGGPRIFRAEGEGWKEVRTEIRDAGGAHFGYGGVAVGDMDGDGKPDIVAIGHLAGATILFNEGNWRFRADNRGLPVEMSGRSLALGDLNGDGRLDVVAQSDESEYTRYERQKKLEKPGEQPKTTGEAAEASGSTYTPGVDTRFFLAQADGRYQESHSGLDLSCYGYSVALDAKPADGGAPFLVTSCRYSGRTQVIYGFDREASTFVRAGLEIVERNGYHISSAVGTYRGKPAAYVTYIKTSPQGAARSFSGQGVSVYYRDGAVWKSERVVKALQSPPWDFSGLAVGDLDGDGRDDVVLADDATSRLRIFFQAAGGGFEELAPELQPALRNRAASLRVADLDGDGRKDIVLMYEFRSSSRTRAGGLRVFMNRLPGEK